MDEGAAVVLPWLEIGVCGMKYEDVRGQSRQIDFGVYLSGAFWSWSLAMCSLRFLRHGFIWTERNAKEKSSDTHTHTHDRTLCKTQMWTKKKA